MDVLQEHFSSKRYLDDKEVPIPLSHAMSICALLVWKPADPADTPLPGVLLPGSAPQSKIFEGLEHLRHLEELKHRTCSQLSLGIKYEERVKVKTTRKQVVKTSVAKQKAEILRPSSPVKTKTEEKKVVKTKDEITAKRIVSKDAKLISKKVKKRSRSRSKEQRLITDEEEKKQGIESQEEEIAESVEAGLTLETEPLPQPAEEVKLLKEETPEVLIGEEKIFARNKGARKEVLTPEEQHVLLELQEERKKKSKKLYQKKRNKKLYQKKRNKKLYQKKKNKKLYQKKKEQKLYQKKKNKKLLAEEKKEEEIEKTLIDKGNIKSPKAEAEHIKPKSPVQDEVKKSPDEVKPASPDKEKTAEPKLVSEKVPKKKLASRTIPSESLHCQKHQNAKRT
ncbi:microtubule-associated protein futsch [Caerostris extrusa]|uniref:Microtubule-associated protein futsch n=1 Tax=Caerostris extrusa TaxID=172846 RepID=A0AAV4XIK2_CAEEX|nr:microtubule-associated protein futsch [Caerostris extrusa]